MSDQNDSMETTMAALEELDEEASLEEKNETLEAFAEAVIELPTGTQALVLDDARELLTWVSAPARTLQEYVDQAADSETNGEHEGSGQSVDFSDPTPSEEPVDGAELLEELEETFCEYLDLPDFAPTALALWTLLTYCFDEFTIAPILAIQSPTKRCGKTTLLYVLEALVSRAQLSSSITAAAIYRIIEAAHPTLLIDEADSFLGQDARHRNVLNSGHHKSGHAILCGGSENEVRRFSTFAPKAIGLIGELPSTLRDRSIPLPLQRKPPNVEVKRLPRGWIRDECDQLRRRMVRWVRDHRDEIDTREIDVPDELDDRAADNWRPLLAVADVAGEIWLRRATSAALNLSGGEAGREKEAKVQLLWDLHTVLSYEGTGRIRSKKLAEELGDLEGRPWATWSRGGCITTNALAQMLRPFGIKPQDLWFGTGDEGATYRGYERNDFQDTFHRYGIGGSDDPQEAQEAA